jgi:RNA polymerase subunit RPABC4/transcription elongation factor Spt4
VTNDWSQRILDRLGRKGTIAVGVLLAIVFVAAGGPLLLASASMSLAGFLAFTAVLVGPALWVFADARRRGMSNPFAWGLFGLLCNVVGAIVYLLVRDRWKTERPCATCGRPVASNHAACPWCGALAHTSKRSCQRCHNELELDWRFCPYCRTEAGSTSTAP